MALTAPSHVEIDSDSISDRFELTQSQCDDLRSPDDIQARIWSALGKLKAPSAFTAGGHTASYTNPGLHIKNYGTVGLPLSKGDADAIINEAKQSPFGKGEHTLVDTSVRTSWELDAHEISLRNPAWNEQVQECLRSVCATLGLTQIVQSISAELYKLLLYEPGAFFKPHRDSEKCPGMFGTLIICLPSKHEGGDLKLEHAGEKYTFETQSNSEFGLSFAAWYSDVSHEIVQVTSGYRLVLTYNLVRKPDNGSNCPAPLIAPNLGARKLNLSGLLTEYGAKVQKDKLLPQFLLHGLDYKYTKANLKEASLKGSDVSVLQVLKQLRQQCKIDLYLATLELEVVRDDEGHDEEYDRFESLSQLVELDGSIVGQCVPLLDAAIANTDPRPRDEENADEVQKSGFTGNEGMTARFWYRQTVVVIVPHATALEFVCGERIRLSKPLLLLRNLMQDHSSIPHRQQRIMQLCRHAISRSGRTHWEHMLGREDSSETFLQEAAGAMLELDAFEMFQEACKKTSGTLALTNGASLGAALRKTGFERMRLFLEQGIQSAQSIAACCQFLADIEGGMKPKNCVIEVQTSIDFWQWSKNVLQSAALRLAPLTRSDGEALARMSMKHWSTFEKVLSPILTADRTLGRIAFLDSFMRDNSMRYETKLQFASHLAQLTWTKFEYTCFSKTMSPDNNPPLMQRQANTATASINATDLRIFMEDSQILLKPFEFEKQMLPILLNAIPSASSEANMHVFPDLIKAIAEDKFRPSWYAASSPSDMYKTFVQSLFTSYIKIAIGSCPEKPRTWALPCGHCNCIDCLQVNIFLTDPDRTTLDLPCGKPRRHHLHQQFTNIENKSYEVETIRFCNPNIWRITKNHAGYDRSHSEWTTKRQTAITLMETLTRDPGNKARLVELLGPYFDAAMSMRVDRLPTMTSSAPLQPISLNVTNRTPVTVEKGTVNPPHWHKRGLSSASAPIHIVDKRFKTGPDQSENAVRDTNEEIEIVDLTDL